MQEILFHRASREDTMEIIKLRRKVWDATYRGIYPDEMIDAFDYEWHLQAEQRRLANPDFHCFLVKDGNEAVGYFSYGKVASDYWKNYSFRLHSLYLLPEYQNRGIGKRIFQQAVHYCRELGYDKMCLDCHPDNHRALAFYLHMGGTIVQEDVGHENRQENGVTIGYSIL